MLPGHRHLPTTQHIHRDCCWSCTGVCLLALLMQVASCSRPNRRPVKRSGERPTLPKNSPARVRTSRPTGSTKPSRPSRSCSYSPLSSCTSTTSPICRHSSTHNGHDTQPAKTPGVPRQMLDQQHCPVVPNTPYAEAVAAMRQVPPQQPSMLVGTDV